MPSMMYIPAAHPPYMQQPWMSYPYIQQPMQGMASLGSTRSTSLPGSYMGRGSASDLERQGRFPPAGPPHHDAWRVRTPTLAALRLHALLHEHLLAMA